MAEDLWKLRKKRGLSVQQLAGKSGVPAVSIIEYEKGQPVRIADLARLARALFVDELDIKIQSDPPARRVVEDKAPRPEPEDPAPKPMPKKEPKEAPARPERMARPTQIEHLLNLARIVGDDETVLVAAAGKPLQELTLVEVRQLLGEYHQKVADFKQMDESERPAGTRRRRASLPEGIDEYEQNYLTACQAAGDVLQFVLLNGEKLTGRVTGYSPYFITILQADGRETTVHKLALAYYHKETPA